MKRKVAIIKTVDIVVSDVARNVCGNTCDHGWAETETQFYCALFEDEKLEMTTINGEVHAKRCTLCMSNELVCS